LNLGVEFDFNDRSALNYTSSIDASSISNVTSGSLYEVSHRLRHGRCKSVRFTLSDATGSEEGFRLQIIRLRAAQLQSAKTAISGRRIY
jgi:hypothetical protein